MRDNSPRERRLINPRCWRFLFLLIISIGGCGRTYAQDEPSPCRKIPQGNWSAKTQQYRGPGSEATPYQIVAMTVEPCNGYLYLSNLSMNGPKVRPFFTVELSIFIYRDNDNSKPIVQEQAFRMGAGDGDLDEVGNWRTTAGRRWGAAFGAGSEPLMQPWIKDGKLDGSFVVALGISFISYGKQV